MRRRGARPPVSLSEFAGFRFPPEGKRAGGPLLPALRPVLPGTVEELLAERGLVVNHVTVYRGVQRFTPLLIDAARPCRHTPGDRWFVDETYVKVSGRWIYLYRAVDRFGQVIDVFASDHRDLAAARKFVTRALSHGRRPVEVTTDQAATYPRVLDELLPAAHHSDARRANNRIESDHSQLKARLRPMRGLARLRSAQTVSSRHAFVQNVRRGHDELGVGADPHLRVSAAFTELTLAI